MTHTFVLISFLLLAAATVYACIEKAFGAALIAAGLACYVLPTAFQLHS